MIWHTNVIQNGTDLNRLCLNPGKPPDQPRGSPTQKAGLPWRIKSPGGLLPPPLDNFLTFAWDFQGKFKSFYKDCWFAGEEDQAGCLDFTSCPLLRCPWTGPGSGCFSSSQPRQVRLWFALLSTTFQTIWGKWPWSGGQHWWLQSIPGRLSLQKGVCGEVWDVGLGLEGPWFVMEGGRWGGGSYVPQSKVREYLLLRDGRPCNDGNDGAQHLGKGKCCAT